jgi:hypothetical protein
MSREDTPVMILHDQRTGPGRVYSRMRVDMSSPIHSDDVAPMAVRQRIEDCVSPRVRISIPGDTGDGVAGLQQSAVYFDDGG